MKVSISKSVGRAFDVMEIFRETRKPATATEIRRRLECPHSSVVAVLHNLADLGYLSYDESTRLYFPTRKLSVLGTWVQPALKGSGHLRDLADAITLDSGHTTAISCRNALFLNIVYVRRGHHPRAAQFSTGIGVPLTKSTPGLAILSQIEDDEIADIVKRVNSWAEKAKAEQTCKLEDVMRAVEGVRRDGYAIGFNCSLEHTGAIAYPLPSPYDGSPLCISATGLTTDIRPQADAIRATMDHYLRLHASEAPLPWPRAPKPDPRMPMFAARRPQVAALSR